MNLERDKKYTLEGYSPNLIQSFITIKDINNLPAFMDALNNMREFAIGSNDFEMFITKILNTHLRVNTMFSPQIKIIEEVEQQETKE